MWFSGDDRAEFAALARARMADDPTIYACVSSVTDPSQAPAGGENWFLLVNVPAGIGLDADAERRRRARRARRPRRRPADRVEWCDVITPLQLAGRSRARPGRSTARRRTVGGPRSCGRGNRGARRGLYLVGGSSHPGGGLPLVAMSAAIVADMIPPP